MKVKATLVCDLENAILKMATLASDPTAASSIADRMSDSAVVGKSHGASEM